MSVPDPELAYNAQRRINEPSMPVAKEPPGMKWKKIDDGNSGPQTLEEAEWLRQARDWKSAAQNTAEEDEERRAEAAERRDDAGKRAEEQWRRQQRARALASPARLNRPRTFDMPVNRPFHSTRTQHIPPHTQRAPLLTPDLPTYPALAPLRTTTQPQNAQHRRTSPPPPLRAARPPASRTRISSCRSPSQFPPPPPAGTCTRSSWRNWNWRSTARPRAEGRGAGRGGRRSLRGTGAQNTRVWGMPEGGSIKRVLESLKEGCEVGASGLCRVVHPYPPTHPPSYPRRISCCLDTDEELNEDADGFYDMWGDFSEAEAREQGRCPTLRALLELDSGGPELAREALLVDRRSDALLAQLCEMVTNGVNGLGLSKPMEVRASWLAFTVVRQMGGPCKPEDLPALEERWAAAAVELRRHGKGCAGEHSFVC